MKKGLILILLICLQSLCCWAQGDGFAIDTISNTVFARMQGHSFPKDCTISRSELRYLTVKHFDAQGKEHQGELVCNKAIANDLIDIFRQLHQAHYPIERIELSQRLSKHSMGMAVDINPLHNPCVSKRKDGSVVIEPAAGKRYADRSKKSAYKLKKGDLCYRLFKSHGFSWGGDWRSKKDYQHFER